MQLNERWVFRDSCGWLRIAAAQACKRKLCGGAVSVAMVGSVDEALGPIDVLVNHAGIGPAHGWMT